VGAHANIGVRELAVTAPSNSGFLTKSKPAKLRLAWVSRCKSPVDD